MLGVNGEYPLPILPRTMASDELLEDIRWATRAEIRKSSLPSVTRSQTHVLVCPWQEYSNPGNSKASAVREWIRECGRNGFLPTDVCGSLSEFYDDLSTEQVTMMIARTSDFVFVIRDETGWENPEEGPPPSPITRAILTDLCPDSDLPDRILQRVRILVRVDNINEEMAGKDFDDFSDRSFPDGWGADQLVVGDDETLEQRVRTELEQVRQLPNPPGQYWYERGLDL